MKKKKPAIRTITFIDGPAEGKRFQFPADLPPVEVADEIEELTGCRYLICGEIAAFVDRRAA